MSLSSIQSVSNVINGFDSVNLTNCDREPIHIPRAIQSHGILMVLSDPDLSIAQVSENATEILGIATADLLDRPLANFVESDRIESIHSCLNQNFEHINPLPLAIATADGKTNSFNGIVHRAPSGEIILELEPVDFNVESDFFQFYRLIKDTLAKMQTTQSLTELCDLVVREMHKVTGSDDLSL
ncbi:MAG: hypothetical protein DCF19_06785 [Pseudanabaena frigida]|uniref:PAS fold-2 domain-containing protein n=1 Tax=Pseudanabaena frigida TaxID=945775 RepID=A0A2W4WE17_9CYAN|nr:MAG: hypothetical protein DCF19_06785 [Pseudanabaena frigida]